MKSGRRIRFIYILKQLNNLSHFEGFCVPIVELCPLPGYHCSSKPESWFCDHSGVFAFGPSPAFSAIFLINELSLFTPTATF